MTKQEFKQLVKALELTLKETKVAKKDRPVVQVHEMDTIVDRLTELLVKKVTLKDGDDDVLYYGPY